MPRISIVKQPGPLAVEPRLRSVQPVAAKEVFFVCERFDELNWVGTEQLSLAYLRVTTAGQVRRAVAYLRVPVPSLERIAALVEQQNALQRFADGAGYQVARRYVEGDGV